MSIIVEVWERSPLMREMVRRRVEGHMKVSMVDGLGGVNTRQRALRAKRLANLVRHCRLRG